jgi:hypothetical protein
MKCIPITCSGRWVAAASSVIEIEDVFDDHDIRPGAVRQGHAGADIFRPGAVLLIGDALFGVQLFDAARDVAESLVEHGLVDVDQHHLIAGQRTHLRDTVSHRARADHADL